MIKLSLRRTARREGSMGIGIRYMLPVVVLNGPTSVSQESELQLDLLLWQVRLKLTSKPRKTYKVW